MRYAIASPDAPAAIGPYSQAIRAGSFLFVSGQIAIDPATGEMTAGDVAAQTHRVLTNVGEILKAAGASFATVTRTTVYLADLADFSAMNAVYAEFFQNPAPARSTVQAAALPRGARVEIDAIAVLD